MNFFDTLPLELLHVIACESEPAYKAMLAYPRFARDVTPSTLIDYMIVFGHDVHFHIDRIEWSRNNLLHRINGPAVAYLLEYSFSCVEFYTDEYDMIWHFNYADDEHEIEKYGDELWYRNGLKHRDIEPAVIYANGFREWYQDDVLHRDDGPARIREIGDKEWYQHGLKHRDNGPALVRADGKKLWYQNGNCRGAETFLMCENGNKCWFRDGNSFIPQ